jgi:hypothetical protein
VCGSPDRDQIDCELAAGQSMRGMAERLGVSASALQRHKRHHLTPAIVRVARQRRGEETARGAYVSVLDRLEDLAHRIDGFIDTAERKGSIVGGAAVLREMRSTLETIARITGELDERAQVQVVNVLASPEFVALSQGFLRALAVLPETVRFEFLDAIEANVPELAAS